MIDALLCSNVCFYFLFFFFSSRRRHTRLTCDWSSDVCSSDLNGYIVTSRGGDWLTQLGVGQLVQINLGRDDQVQPGEFLTVFRDVTLGIPQRQVLGEVAVLTAESHTATAKIVLMRQPKKVGDRVEVR